MQWESFAYPGMYEAISCTTQWNLNATRFAGKRENLERYLGDKSFSSGDRTVKEYDYNYQRWGTVRHWGDFESETVDYKELPNADPTWTSYQSCGARIRMYSAWNWVVKADGSRSKVWKDDIMYY